jgi:hypothetical protein
MQVRARLGCAAQQQQGHRLKHAMRLGKPASPGPAAAQFAKSGCSWKVAGAAQEELPRKEGQGKRQRRPLPPCRRRHSQQLVVCRPGAPWGLRCAVHRGSLAAVAPAAACPRLPGLGGAMLLPQLQLQAMPPAAACRSRDRQQAGGRVPGLHAGSSAVQMLSRCRFRHRHQPPRSAAEVSLKAFKWLSKALVTG